MRDDEKMRGIIFCLVFLLCVSLVMAGSVTYETTKQLSSVGADPVRLSVRFLVTLSNGDCGKVVCGDHTLTGDFRDVVEDWLVYDSPGSTLVGTCELSSSSANFVKICCSPTVAQCSMPLEPNQAGWSMSGIVNVYGTGSMNFCYERISGTSTVGKFSVGSTWCNYAVASECLSGGMISSDPSKMGVISRDDCGAKGDTCVRGECVDGCETRDETYPKGGSAYRAGARVCLNPPYLSECQSDGTWKVVEECSLGCSEGGSGCRYDSSYLCTLKRR